MKKVVAFLEQYAEWLALGVAAIFFLFVVWGYVVSPSAVQVKVAKDELSPGEIDPTVQKDIISSRLQPAMEAKADDLVMVVPNFAEQFQLAMGPNRPAMSAEQFAGAQPARPLQAGQTVDTTVVAENQGDQKIDQLPKVPAPLAVVSSVGNSLVAPPAQHLDPQQQQDPDALPVQPALPAGADAQLANAIEKNWVTIETKLPMKDLAEEWKRVFYDMRVRKPKNGIPASALQTHFMQIEVEREELTGPDTWGNKVTLKPVDSVPSEVYPKPGDREQQERYRLWAEQNQIHVAEPAFYQVLKGDQWYIPSVGAPKDPQLAATEAQPFDPANPPDRQLTPEEKRLVYVYKQKERQEQQKADAAARRSSTDAARGAGGGPPPGIPYGGGRRLGGYAPLPMILAAGQGVSDRNPPPQPQPGNTGGTRGRPPVPPPQPPYGPRGGIPTGPPWGSGPPPGLNIPRGPGGPPPGFRPPAPPRLPAGVPQPDYLPGYAPGYTPGFEGTNPNAGPGVSTVPTGPFDPVRLPPDATGKMPEMSVWAHDDTVQPGKTYRYRMRVKLKNPLYNTFNVAKTPELSAQYTIDSPWTEWKEVKAPRNTEYFFASTRTQIKEDTVLSATVDVFKRTKGEWTKETFTVAPGDSIGGVKNGVDYSTGATLVDLRKDVRGRDVRIMVADDSGTIDRIDFNAQKEDAWYKTLLEKIRGPQPPPGTPVVPAGYGTPPGAEPGGVF